MTMGLQRALLLLLLVDGWRCGGVESPSGGADNGDKQQLRGALERLLRDQAAAASSSAGAAGAVDDVAAEPNTAPAPSTDPVAEPEAPPPPPPPPPPLDAIEDPEQAGQLYLAEVERRIDARSYRDLIRVLTGHASGRFSSADVLRLARKIFEETPDLIDGLLTFLPEEDLQQAPATAPEEQTEEDEDSLEVGDVVDEKVDEAALAAEIAARDEEIAKAQEAAARAAHAEAARKHSMKAYEAARKKAEAAASATRAARRSEADKLLVHVGALAALVPAGAADGGELSAVEPTAARARDGTEGSADGGPKLALTERATKLADCWWEAHGHATAATLVGGLMRQGRSGILPSEARRTSASPTQFAIQD